MPRKKKTDETVTQPQPTTMDLDFGGPEKPPEAPPETVTQPEAPLSNPLQETTGEDRPRGGPTMEQLDQTLGNPDASKNTVEEKPKRRGRQEEKTEGTVQTALSGEKLSVHQEPETKEYITFSTEKLQVRYSTDALEEMRAETESKKQRAIRMRILRKIGIKKDVELSEDGSERAAQEKLLVAAVLGKA